MTIEEAKNIIRDNYECKAESFVYFLHEKDSFSKEQFWNFYDSIACLVRADEEKTPELTMQITRNYEHILKYFIYHFNPKDEYKMKDFPENFNGYLERLDYILSAYHNSYDELLDDSFFELQR